MQGQRSTIDSFPETFDYNHGSSSSSTGVDQQILWNNMQPAVDNRLPDSVLPPPPYETNTTYENSVSRDKQSLSRWNLAEPSFTENRQNQVIDDEFKMEHGWSSSLTALAEPRLEEMHHEPTNFLSLESVNVNLSRDQAANGSLRLQNSSADGIPQNENTNAGYVGSNGNGVQVMEAGVCPHLFKSGGSETEKIPSASGSSNTSVVASGSAGYFAEDNDGRSGRSFDGRRLSRKRKTLDGASGQSSLGGSSGCFQRSENSVWHDIPARCNADSSLIISTPTENSPSVSPEQLNPRLGLVTRGVASDNLPTLSVAGNTESSLRNFRMRIDPNISSTRRSHVLSPHQSSRLLPYNRSLDSGSTSAAANTSPQSQSHVLHMPGLQRNVHPFPWNRISNSGAGSSSSSPVIFGERIAPLQEEANPRSMPRNISEHPMVVHANETRNLAQDPTNWNLANGNVIIPGNVASTSRIGSSSSVHQSPAPTWVPHHNPSTQYPRRLSEFVHRSLFPSAGSASGGQSSNFPPMQSGPSASSIETVLSSGAGHQGHHLPSPRPVLWMERQNDGALGVPYSLRTLAAASEGRRSRLVSEIRNALDLMRRGENLRFEDVMIFDQPVFYGVADLHDRHRDMRLDVDSMSYEELLALEERIGNVSTGLNVETILKCLKQRKYSSITIGSPCEVEPCCICQEEYVDGDHLGKIDCGHDFHTNCIKQWVVHKNLCPICKTTALVT
ncbi:hypothetical protein HHK36_030948 [Tetracentron sinense]|uniref:RING-type E3 ubiquitin transferase n=1 Tax=Tetracentron sinense TaxID=13715 RepID=A0A834YD28_TETSI|nr:hypothetical protein HHK36_030948 [Tetracentron sinense]